MSALLLVFFKFRKANPTVIETTAVCQQRVLQQLTAHCAYGWFAMMISVHPVAFGMFAHAVTFFVPVGLIWNDSSSTCVSVRRFCCCALYPGHLPCRAPHTANRECGTHSNRPACLSIRSSPASPTELILFDCFAGYVAVLVSCVAWVRPGGHSQSESITVLD